MTPTRPLTALPALLALAVALLALPPAAAAAAADPLLVLSEAQQRQAGVQLARPVPAGGMEAGGALLLQGSVVPPPQALGLVSAPMGGVVQAVLVDSAETVRPGQVVARLHSPMLMATQRDYLQLRLQAEQADERLAREERLAADGIIALARVQEARNTAQQARLAAQERRQALRLAGVSDAQLATLVASAAVQPALAVPSPVAGQVAEVLVQPGQQVEAGAPLLRVVRPVPLALALQATPAQAAQLRPGAAVQLRDCDLAGTVRGLAPAMQGSNQAVIVQVALARAAACVQPNQVVSASVALPATGAGAVQVPAAALLQLGGRDHVFVRDGRGFRPQPVTLLAREGALARVRGLAADAQVAVAGVAALKGAWLGLGETVPAAPSVAASGAR